MGQNQTYKKLGEQLFWIAVMETNIVTPLSTTISFNVEKHNEDVDIDTNPINPTLKTTDFFYTGESTLRWFLLGHFWV